MVSRAERGNEVIVYNPERQSEELLRIDFPRQREGRLLSIADFFSPKSSGRMDVIGFSVVTIGSRASEATQRLFESGDFTKYLYLHGYRWRRRRRWQSTCTL